MQFKKIISIYRIIQNILFPIPYSLFPRQGFSYIEFLIVITFTVIMALGTTFSLLRFIEQQRPQYAARVIRATLRDAHQRSIVQEEGKYWGVRFKNFPAPSSDLYMLIQSSVKNATSYSAINTVYLNDRVQFSEPATDMEKIIMFDKRTGNLILSSCPSATESSIITINTISIRVYCNGKIE